MTELPRGNPKNPRTISASRLKSLRESLEKFGDLGGIVLNVTTGQLVGGHQRVEAFRQAMDAGDAQVTVERKQAKDKTGTVGVGAIVVGGVRFAYREVEWDKATEDAANLAANRHGGEWDFEAVSEILKALPDDMLGLTGFEDHELENLRAADWVRPAPADAPQRDNGHAIHVTDAQLERLHAAKKRLEAKTKKPLSDGQAVEELAVRYIKGR